jgi:heme/copper-type cytochrome/quinol oxidase subunit 2
MNQTIWRGRTARRARHKGRPARTDRPRQRIRPLLLTLLLGVPALWIGRAAADDQVFALKLMDGKFDPAEVVVPADTPLQLQVTNSDAAAIEFESFELHRERVVQPGETITVYLPALKAGTYPFFDDFHKETTQGSIVSK